MTNLEPWKVDHKITIMENDQLFAQTLKRLPISRDKYLHMLQILDLQAFGNSILEVMVG